MDIIQINSVSHHAVCIPADFLPIYLSPRNMVLFHISLCVLFLLLARLQFSHLEPVLSSGIKSAGESYKAERWLFHSLQAHKLSAQLRPLLRHLGHTRKYYNGEFTLMVQFNIENIGVKCKLK